MKKILFISFAILLMCGVAFAATPGNATSPGHGDIMNQGGFNSNPPKHFVMVRYMPASGSLNSATLTADSLVIWDLTSDDGITVTTTATSGDGAVAGIIVNAALTPETLGNSAFNDVGKRNWTWLQTYGKSQADFFIRNPGIASAGQTFGTSTVVGVPTGFSSSVSAKGKAAGFVFDAVTSATSNVEVFLKCE